ncbi:hypothetical protein PZA11_006205 [Diplocarpon coronariae]
MSISKGKIQQAPDLMKELVSAFSKQMRITKFVKHILIDHTLSAHLFLPTYNKPFRKIASRVGYNEFLIDLEQLNGGMEISMEIVDSAWFRFVEEAHKDESASKLTSEIENNRLFNRAMEQVYSHIMTWK